MSIANYFDHTAESNKIISLIGASLSEPHSSEYYTDLSLIVWTDDVEALEIFGVTTIPEACDDHCHTRVHIHCACAFVTFDTATVTEPSMAERDP